tara:strand:- start:52 stop:270 length:219 start_codon:yes stop_codon:yes gene_type:complete
MIIAPKSKVIILGLIKVPKKIVTPPIVAINKPFKNNSHAFCLFNNLLIIAENMMNANAKGVKTNPNCAVSML